MAFRLRISSHKLKGGSGPLAPRSRQQPPPVSIQSLITAPINRTISSSTSPGTLNSPPSTDLAAKAGLPAVPLGTLPLSWPHKGWDHDVASQVVPSHRPPRTASDRLAYGIIRICRWWMDFLSGMPPEVEVGAVTCAPGGHGKKATRLAQSTMTESQWLVRFIFLESLAGIPGLVAGGLRHLSSIRRFSPDRGWIKTLLEESYNERMHLLTFLEMYKPGFAMRSAVFLAQGAFYNALFLAYLISPRFVHRLVGYLEEEAVHTYTRCLREMDAGLLPGWTEASGGGGGGGGGGSSGFKIPEFAVRYWNMGEGRRGMRDLLLYIRADEASHRGVNHTLGNLDQLTDPNPFIDDGHHLTDRSHMAVAAIKPAGLEREEVVVAVGKQMMNVQGEVTV